MNRLQTWLVAIATVLNQLIVVLSFTFFDPQFDLWLALKFFNNKNQIQESEIVFGEDHED